MSPQFSDTSKQPTFQLKGTMLAITVFELAHFNIERLIKELSAKVKEAPEFFGTIPMVLGIDKLDIPLTRVELKGILNLFKELNIQLMALRTDDEKAIIAAHKLGLVVLPPAGAREKLIDIAVNRPVPVEETIPTVTQAISTVAEDTPTDIQEQKQLSIKETSQDSSTEEVITEDISPIETKQQTAEHEPPSIKSEQTAIEEPPKNTATIKHQTNSTMIISTPVRSGQQITAHDCDLIITSNISTGAELMADGNIHIYGNMHGRAMAGFRGNSHARVFCTKLTAQLISIAGQMITEEELRHHPLWGKPAQLSLVENQLIISPLS